VLISLTDKGESLPMTTNSSVHIIVDLPVNFTACGAQSDK